MKHAESTVSPSFKVFVALTGFLLGLGAGGMDTPAGWTFGALCAFIGQRFSEALLAVFVIFFPLALFVAGVMAYFLR